MAKPVEVSAAAVDEAEAAASWYAEQDPDVAAAFVDELRGAMRRIGTAPARWPAHVFDTRRVLLKRFPYAVVYLNEPARVLIVAVAHQHRRPGYWRDR